MPKPAIRSAKRGNIAAVILLMAAGMVAIAIAGNPQAVGPRIETLESARSRRVSLSQLDRDGLAVVAAANAALIQAAEGFYVVGVFAEQDGDMVVIRCRAPADFRRGRQAVQAVMVAARGCMPYVPLERWKIVITEPWRTVTEQGDIARRCATWTKTAGWRKSWQGR